jgi:hypothetical protein
MNKQIQKQLIGSSIYLIRGQRVMLDEDLAKLYGVETKVLNQSVRRNISRFPEDFMFSLSKEEYTNLKSQFVTSSWGGRRITPMAFTEHGTVMLASILRSKQAIQMSIEVVKAFVSLRRIHLSHNDVSKQLTELRSFMLKSSNKTDIEFNKVWKAIEKLTNYKGDESINHIGFKND